MNDNLNELLNKFTDFLKNEAKTETVIGKEFQLGEFKCVPVIGVGFGFGGGLGEGNHVRKGQGSGIGGCAGLGMGPCGFLVTHGDQIQFIPVHQSKGLSAAFEKIPELMEKYFSMKKDLKAPPAP